MLETYLDFLEQGYYEGKFAFDGLADDKVWKRPADGILSIGELASHIAYWEAVRLAGEEGEFPDLSKCRVKSLLIDPRFSYYPETVPTSPSAEQLAMSASQVCNELMRVHSEAVNYLQSINPNLDAYRDKLKYLAFHVAYHVGQMYTVRHLLGDQPPNN